MFSKTIEYALRSIVHLAQNSNDTLKTSEIAEATKVPPAYLAKVLQALRTKGIVSMQRGIGGGVSLAREPEQLTMLDIVNAVDPIQRISLGPVDLMPPHLIALHEHVDRVIAEVESAFGGTTIRELLGAN